MFQSYLLADHAQFAPGDSVLVLNSVADPVVASALHQVKQGKIILAEDDVGALSALPQRNSPRVQHVPFHEYSQHFPAETIDVALFNLLYQPGSSWVRYALQLAYYALHLEGKLYVSGAKERGIVSTAKHMQELFGNAETLSISKGQRVICARKMEHAAEPPEEDITVFAGGKLDEGTRLLIEALDVRVTDNALDLGCGAGYIGLHIARLATKGYVTMVDSSLAALVSAHQNVQLSGLSNIEIVPSDGTSAISMRRFDLVATNPPFHHGGIQSTATAERFIREAAQVLRLRGRFYLVANRFLKYEPVLKSCFQQVQEVAGDTRYKVLLSNP